MAVMVIFSEKKQDLSPSQLFTFFTICFVTKIKYPKFYHTLSENNAHCVSALATVQHESVIVSSSADKNSSPFS